MRAGLRNNEFCLRGLTLDVCGQKKIIRTLAIDSPFQTFAVRTSRRID